MAASTVRECLGKARIAFLGVGVFSGIINLLALTGSLYMLQIYDRVLPSKSVPTLAALTILMLLLYAGFGALDFARLRLLTRIGLGLDRRLRGRVFETVLALPLRTKQSANGLQLVRDLDQIRGFLSGLGPTALFDMPWIPIYLALIYMLHPVLGAFAIVGAVLLVCLTALAEMKTRAPAMAAVQSGLARSAFGEAARRNAEVIHAMGLERRIVARWRQLNDRFLSDHTAMADVIGGIGSHSRTLRVALQSGVLGVGAYLAIGGELTAGSIIAASIVMSRALAPIEIAIANWKGLVSARQSAKRLDRSLALFPRREEIMSLPRPSQVLEVQNLTLAPPGQLAPTIVNVSFKLEAGEGLGVIGASAAGKSTLMRALVGAWLPAPRGGSVRLDGATLDQWSPEMLGCDIGYLPQEIDLFDGTVAENIARLDPNASSESVIAAARLAGIHDIILNLTEGYQTRIGEGGLKLSAGQRQRLGLARALYGDPFLVVLDEPNSNLDVSGDVALTRAIKAVRARRGIVIVVAHRPPALAELNKVLLLSKGQVQALGPRDEILRSVLKPVSTSQGAVAPNHQTAASAVASGA